MLLKEKDWYWADARFGRLERTSEDGLLRKRWRDSRPGGRALRLGDTDGRWAECRAGFRAMR